MLRTVLDKVQGIMGGRGFNPSTETFPPVDVDAISMGLKLERRGVQDAKAGIPKSDAESLSQAEHAVVERVGALRKKGLASYELQIGAYRSRIRGASASRGVVELAAGRLKTNLEKRSRVCANHLSNAMGLVEGTHEKLQVYRERHGAIGPPDSPKNHFFMSGIILILFVVEVGLSGTLFAERNTMGLIGGMGIAMIISGVNVMACLLCGFGARYVNLRPVGAKFFGFLAFLLFLGVLAGLNLTVAHFRDALERYEWDEAVFQSITSLRQNVFGIDSFNSWVVAAFGVIVSIISFIEGLVWYDRHPGFNKTYDAANNAVRHYAKQYEQAQDQLTEIYKEAEGELKGHAQKMRARIQSAMDAVGDGSTLTQELNTFLENCDRAVNQLHATYRESNTKVRSDERPKHFNKDFSFEKYSLSADLSNADTADAKKEIDKVDKIVEDGVDDILEAHKSAISAFPTVQQLKNRLQGGAVVRGPHSRVDAIPNEGPRIEGASG